MTGRSTDGRHRRREVNRDKVIESLLGLFADGEINPTMAMVAERAGISQRSIFRYFDDTEDLIRQACQFRFTQMAPLATLPTPFPDALSDRIKVLGEVRSRTYEAAGPVGRIARVHAMANPVAREILTVARTQLRAQVAALFSPELARCASQPQCLSAIDVLWSFETWELLRIDQELSVDDAVAVLALATGRLLSA